MKPSAWLQGLLLIAGMFAGSSSLFGQAYPEWTGSGTNWTTGSNWTNGNGGAYGQLEFKGGGNVSSNNDFASLSQWRFYFSGSKAYTLTGNSVNLFDFGTAHSWLLSDSTANQAINLNVNFAATSGNTFAQVSTRSSGNLTLNTLGITGSVVSQARFVGESTGSITVNGAISGTGKDVVIGVNQAGTDFGSTNVTFNGSNSYSGQTFISAGTLNLGSGSSMATSAFQLGQTSGTAGATLNLASTTGGQNFSNLLTVRAGSSGTKTISSANSSGTNTLSGAVTLNTDLTTLVNSSGGTLAFAGGMNVGANKLTVLGGGSTSISGALTSSLGTGGFLVKQGAGTLTLGSTSNNYTGTNSATLNASGTQIAGGTVAIAGDTSLGLAPAGAYNNIQFTGTGTLRANANIGLHANRSVSIASGQTATFDNNGNTFTVNGIINGTGGNVGSTGGGTTVFTAANTYDGTTTIHSGTLQIGNGGSTGNLGSGAVTNNAALVFNRSGNFVLTNAIGGSGTFAQSGSNIITISSANTYAGATTINSGTLRVTANEALGTGAAGTTVNSGGQLRLIGVNYSTAEPLSINGTGGGTGALYNFGGNSTYAGQVNVATNSTIGSTGGTLHLTGGVVKNGTTLTFTGNGTIHVTSVISGASANSDLVVDGSAVELSAANTYNGPTLIRNGGSLKMSGSGSLPATTTLILDDTGSGLSTFQILPSSGNQTIASLTGSSNSTVDLDNKHLTVGDSATTTYAGLIIGGNTSQLNKTGSGMLKLTGDSSGQFTGTASVANGALVVNGNISTSVASVGSGATLAGTGTVGATTVLSGGTIAPGDGGIESLNVTGSLTLQSGSISAFEINAATDTADLAIASAVMAFGGTLNVSNIAGTLADGDTFNLFDWVGAASGTFSSVNLPSLGSGLTWNTSNLYTNGTIAVVPEPAAALLGGIGLITLLRRRRA